MQDKDVTILMTYFNRKKLLTNTLRSIEKYGHRPKIIIVDDCSTDGDDIKCFEDDRIRVLTLKDKDWMNTCMAFNYGFREVDTEIVIFQNAECVHVGDVVGHALSQMRRNMYLNYSAYSINETLTGRVIAGEPIEEVIQPLNNAEAYWGENGWYNHKEYRPKMFHFCSAIMRKDLHALGGFDERFKRGLGYDDDDLVQRIIRKRMWVHIIDYPFVVHQHHPAYFQDGVRKMRELLALNFHIKRNNHDLKIVDVKPFNTVYC